MTLPKKVFIFAVIIVASFAVGMYSAKLNVAESKKQTEKEIEKEVTEETVIIKEKRPDGGEKTTITTKKETKTVTNETKNSTSTKGTSKRRTLTINALAGVSTNDLSKPIYGFSVTKEVLGPVTVGAWGLTNGTLGVSLGLSF